MGVNSKLISQDVETILYKILNGSAEFKSTINGQIYKDGYRPTNSGKEDVSISVLAMSQENPQIAVVNLNCYVLDRTETISGSTEYVPNSPKLKLIAEKAKATIDEALTSTLYKDFSLRVDYQKTFKNQDPEAREHFQNLRIELIIPNT